ncbi:MAG: N-6 DNA methylase, partial [Planctomycetia bacterium]|nr:N-6 DNA methylase [Planctomycetia bacterium]
MSFRPKKTERKPFQKTVQKNVSVTNSVTSSEIVLDPCCGSGSFLCAVHRVLGLPLTSIFGLDLDPISVQLARINLILDAVEMITETEEEPGSPNIFCGDGLGVLPAFFPEKFQKIATNSPWGARKVSQNTEYETKKSSGSGETFTQFICRAHELLAENGEVVFLLPEAFLNIRAHAPTRRFLLENTHIHEISALGRIFPEIFTPVIRLHTEKKTQTVKNTENKNISAQFTTKIQTSTSSETISAVNDFPQEGFSHFPESVFSLRATPETVRILKKMTDIPHTTLRGHAQWGLGIVTGNNSRWIRETPD